MCSLGFGPGKSRSPGDEAWEPEWAERCSRCHIAAWGRTKIRAPPPDSSSGYVWQNHMLGGRSNRVEPAQNWEILGKAQKAWPLLGNFGGGWCPTPVGEQDCNFNF